MEVARVFFFFDQSKSKEKQNHGLWKLHKSIMKKKWCYVCWPQSLTSLSIHWTYCSALYYPFANLPYRTLLPTIATSFASWVNSTYAAYCSHISKKRITLSQTEHDLSQLSVVTAFLWREIITLLLVQLPVHCGEIYLFFNQWYTNMLNSLFSRVYIFFQSPALFSQNYWCNGIFDYLKPENIPKTGSWGWPRLIEGLLWLR